MSWFQVHALTGMGIGIVAQHSSIPWAGYPLALWTHLPLDDMNYGNARWYHGLGKGWVKAATITGEVISAVVIVYLLWKMPYLIPFVVCACLPDFEHIPRAIMKKKDYWIHNRLWWEPLKRQWGIIAWFVVIALMLGLVI